MLALLVSLVADCGGRVDSFGGAVANGVLSPADATPEAASGGPEDEAASTNPTCPPAQALCGGACVGADAGGNACDPQWIYVPATPSPGPPPIPGIPVSVAIDSHNLYWIDDHGSVMRQPKSGGALVTLASGGQARPAGIAVDPTRIYWSELGEPPDNGSIVSLPILADGGTPSLIAAGGAEVLALRGSTLCFGGQTIGCVPVTGGTPTILYQVPVQPVQFIAVDATNVYWTILSVDGLDFSANGTLSSAPIGGGPVNVLVSHAELPMGVAVDASTVYWIESDSGTVKSMPIAGGTITTLATGPGSAEGYLIVDSGYVFWSAGLGADNGGAVLKMPVTGGTPTVLAWDVGAGGPLLLDEQYVYFAEGNGMGRAQR